MVGMIIDGYKWLHTTNGIIFSKKLYSFTVYYGHTC